MHKYSIFLLLDEYDIHIQINKNEKYYSLFSSY